MTGDEEVQLSEDTSLATSQALDTELEGELLFHDHKIKTVTMPNGQMKVRRIKTEIAQRQLSDFLRAPSDH